MREDLGKSQDVDEMGMAQRCASIVAQLREAVRANEDDLEYFETVLAHEKNDAQRNLALNMIQTIKATLRVARNSLARAEKVLIDTHETGTVH